MSKSPAPDWVRRVEERMEIVGIENKHQLARALGAPYTTISSWWHGPVKFPSKYITKLPKVLECSVSWICFGVEDVKAKPRKRIEKLAEKLDKLKYRDLGLMEGIVDIFLKETPKKRRRTNDKT